MIPNEIPDENVNYVSMEIFKNIKYPTKMKQFQPKNEKKQLKMGSLKSLEVPIKSLARGHGFSKSCLG